MDIRNGSGDPATATTVAGLLQAAGVPVGAVTTTDATASTVQFPAARGAEARLLAQALGVPVVEQPDGPVALVIGAQDAGRVLASAQSPEGRAALACAAA